MKNFSITVVLIFGIIFVEAWYGSYKLRRTFTIKNVLSKTVVNVTAHFELDTKSIISVGQMRSTCYDVIFTDNKDNRIDFFLESGCNKAKTSFWLRIPQMTSLQTMTLFMYFNNDKISTTQGLVWKNRFGTISNTACSGLTLFTEMEGRYALGSSLISENIVAKGSNNHLHATNGESYETKKGTDVINKGKDNTANDQARETHTHMVHLKADTALHDTRPKSRTFSFCYGPKDGEFSGFLVQNTIAMFDNLETVTDWASVPLVNANEEYIFGGQPSDNNKLVGDESHKHDLVFTGAICDPEEGGTQVKQHGAGEVEFASIDHYHSFENCASNSSLNIPPYIYLNFRQVSTSESKFAPGMITYQYCGASKCTIPLGWKKYTKLNGLYPRGTSVGSKLGTTGGSFYHLHNFACWLGGAVTDSKDKNGNTGVMSFYQNHRHIFNSSLPETYNQLDHLELLYIQRNLENNTEMKLGKLEYSCFGVGEDSSDVCEGVGKCVDLNKCVCNKSDEYFGVACNITKCHSIFSNESKVCNSHGVCWGFDNCTCDNSKGYYGKECNEFVNKTEKAIFNSNDSTIFFSLSVAVDIAIIYKRRAITNKEEFPCGERIKNWEYYLAKKNNPPAKCWWVVDSKFPTVTRGFIYRINVDSRIYDDVPDGGKIDYKFYMHLLTKDKNVTYSIVRSGKVVKPDPEKKPDRKPDIGGIIGGVVGGITASILAAIIGGGICVSCLLLCCLFFLIIIIFVVVVVVIVVFVILLIVVCLGALLVVFILFCTGGGAAAGVTAGGAVVVKKGADELLKEQPDIVTEHYRERVNSQKQKHVDGEDLKLGGEDEEASSSDNERIGYEKAEELVGEDGGDGLDLGVKLPLGDGDGDALSGSDVELEEQSIAMDEKAPLKDEEFFEMNEKKIKEEDMGLQLNTKFGEKSKKKAKKKIKKLKKNLKKKKRKDRKEAEKLEAANFDIKKWEEKKKKEKEMKEQSSSSGEDIGSSSSSSENENVESSSEENQEDSD